MKSKASHKLFDWITLSGARSDRRTAMQMQTSRNGKGDASLIVEETEFAPVPQPSITLSPASGEPGSRVTVSGEGFTAGATVRFFLSASSLGVSKPVVAVQADEDGTFAHSLTLPLTWPNGHRIVESAVKIMAASTDFSEKASAEFALTFSIRFQLEQAIEHLWTGDPVDACEDAVLPVQPNLCDGDSRPMFEWSFSEHNGKPIYVSIPIQPRWSGSTS